MMNQNPNDGKCLSSLLFLSKLFYVVSFLFFQNFQAQIFISEGASVYGENEVLVSQIDSLVSNSVKSKIYIFSGVQLSTIGSENNYEIVKILPSENKKTESKKQSVLNIAKAKLEKKVEEKIVSKPENPAIIHEVFSTPKTDVYFSFVDGFSKITVPVSQFSAKQIINSENYKTSLALGWSKLASVYFKNTELLRSQNKSAFSVRPPPFLA